MAVETQEKKPRITYPLSVQEVEKLQGLEKSLKAYADEASNANRVGLHRAYMELMRSTTRIVTRERNRMAREELAARNRRGQELMKQARQNPASQYAPVNEGSTN